MSARKYICEICGSMVSKPKSAAYRGGRACRTHEGVEVVRPVAPSRTEPGTGRSIARGPSVLELMVGFQAVELVSYSRTTPERRSVPRAEPRRILNPDTSGIMELLKDAQPGDEITLRFSVGEEGIAAVNYLRGLSRSCGYKIVDEIGLIAVGSTSEWEHVSRTQTIIITDERFVENMEEGFAYRMGQRGRGRLEWIEFAPPLSD